MGAVTDTGRVGWKVTAVAVLVGLLLVQLSLLTGSYAEDGLDGVVLYASGVYAVAVTLVAVLGGWHRTPVFLFGFSAGLAILVAGSYLIARDVELAVVAVAFGLVAVYYGWTLR